MIDQNAQPSEEATGVTEPAGRERSTIGFPYGDLDDAVEMATGVMHAGGGVCQLEQLAAQLEMAANGGGFRQRLLTAKSFGLITYGQGSAQLTALGRSLMDPAQAASARAAAFLNVPLYKRMFDEYKSGVLPPTNPAIEAAMVGMGVATKIKDKARQTFQRSAQQAGFFWAGTNRLVMPKNTAAPAPAIDPVQPTREPKPDEPRPSRQGGGDGGDGRHPFIAGLIKTLPDEGSMWPNEERGKWLQTAASIFGLIYKTSGDDKTVVTVTITDSTK